MVAKKGKKTSKKTGKKLKDLSVNAKNVKGGYGWDFRKIKK